MAGAYDIYVFEEHRAFYTRPPVATVSKSLGGSVKIRNLTGHPIAVKFPTGLVQTHHDPVPSDPPGPPCVDVVSVEGPGHAEVPLAPCADGIYDYNVEVHLPMHVIVRAPGNSWPKIIVDP